MPVSCAERSDARRRWRAWAASLVVVLVAPVVAPAAQDSPQEPLNGLLGEHVRDGRVDYPAIARDPRFPAYIGLLARRDYAELPRNERLAHLINAYNALAIKGILDGSSPSSFFGRIGYFRTQGHTLAGRKISLYELEHDLLIPLDEPRVHFAINCASTSCPALRSGAYFADRLDAQLDEAARRFVNDETNNRFDRRSRTAFLSRIFDWYASDFLGHADSLPAYLARYVDDPDLARELSAGGWRIEFLDYDWSLNGIAPAS